jgi:hypothetical protein
MAGGHKDTPPPKPTRGSTFVLKEMGELRRMASSSKPAAKKEKPTRPVRQEIDYHEELSFMDEDTLVNRHSDPGMLVHAYAQKKHIPVEVAYARIQRNAEQRRRGGQ